MTEVVTQEEIKKPKLDGLGRSYGTGRRKRSIARVWLKKGSGKITVNKKDINVYFLRPTSKMILNDVFVDVGAEGLFDVDCTVKGGGLSGQAEAILHGIARALDSYNPEAYHETLRKLGLLTRDPRVVERKKYGRKKARKKPQFSKR